MHAAVSLQTEQSVTDGIAPGQEIWRCKKSGGTKHLQTCCCVSYPSRGLYGGSLKTTLLAEQVSYGGSSWLGGLWLPEAKRLEYLPEAKRLENLPDLGDDAHDMTDDWRNMTRNMTWPGTWPIVSIRTTVPPF